MFEIHAEIDDAVREARDYAATFREVTDFEIAVSHDGDRVCLFPTGGMSAPYKIDTLGFLTTQDRLGMFVSVASALQQAAQPHPMKARP